MRQETIRIPEEILWEILEIHHKLEQEIIKNRKPLRLTRAQVFRAALTAGLRGENIKRMNLTQFLAFCKQNKLT
ncbi:hypothetical protein DRO48_02870 [Candidatus Bathyarchaeota archaeon]|nr:MAG: hypothetical protein DRO48_02870 [Candidatus Bathyarchaeota archaeon]